MSYVVLARKWRPQTFDDVVNQKHVVLTLKNALKEKRIANAYLFTGPRGIGKTTVTRILAKAINCDNGISPNPCNECPACKEITDGINFLVREIDGASNTSVDDVRKLQEQIGYSSGSDKYRIFIIDEVHMLSKNAFNALLKTLEEPPSRVIFIFATTEPHKLPATIISRCQRFDFKRLSMKEIHDYLKKVCDEEKIDIEDDVLMLISQKADGGMRDSLSLLDQAHSYCGNEKITMEKVSELLGIIDWNVYFQFTDAILEGNVKTGLEIIEKIFFNGYDLSHFLDELAEHFRNILMVKATKSVSAVDTSEVFKKRYQELAEKFHENDLLQLIQLVSEAQRGIKSDVNPRVFLDMIAVKMIRLPRAEKIENIIEGIESLKTRILQTAQQNNSIKSQAPNGMPAGVRSIRKVPPTQKKIPVMSPNGKIPSPNHSSNDTKENVDESEQSGPPIPSESEADLNIEDLQKQWSSLLESIPKAKGVIASFLAQGDPIEWKQGKLTIALGMENDFHFTYLQKYSHEVESILSNLLKRNLTVKFVKVEREILEGDETNSKDYYLQKLGQMIPIIKDIDEAFDIEIVR